MTTESKTQSQHAGEAAVNQAHRDESKAPAEKYTWPTEVIEHVDAIRKYCDDNRPEIHCLLMLGHEVGAPESGNHAIEINYTASGSDFVLTHLNTAAGDQLAKRMVRNLLKSLDKTLNNDDDQHTTVGL